MPPRFAYWTILIDNAPTAFRARDAQELLPTLAQLKRTNENVVLKWFSGGKLWESPEAAREARRRPKPVEKRGGDWRPGGQHRDPRAKFDRKKEKPVAQAFSKNKPVAQAFSKNKPIAQAFSKNKPVAQAFRPAGDQRPFTPGARKPFGRKPFGAKPFGRKPFGGKPFGGKPGGERPRFAKPWREGGKPDDERKPVAQAFRPAGDKRPFSRPAPPKRRWRGPRRNDEE